MSIFKNIFAKSTVDGSSEQKKELDMAKRDRIVASMLLAAVGDAIGFKNGRWEFCMCFIYF
jgi:uncharacterized membrane protein YhhN